MSTSSREKTEQSTIRYEHRSDYVEQFTSSLTINLRQMQTDLNQQHQHEKATLIELNENLGLFLHRVQSLQLQNDKYLAQIADLYRQSFDVSHFDIQWTEQYTHLHADFATASGTNIDHEFNFELFQLQIEIYQKLIDVEQQWKDDRCLKLEQELQQLTVALRALQTSHGEKANEIRLLTLERQKLFEQYLSLTYEWSNSKKQRKKWDLNSVTLKSQIEFYKNLRTYIQQNFASLIVHSSETIQFSTAEFNDILKKIRRDFEFLYAKIYTVMTSYYEMKMVEIETNVKEIEYNQEIEINAQKNAEESFQIEYEEMQKSLRVEQGTYSKLEATYAKLAAEFESIHQQNQERLEVQAIDYQHMQQNITVLGSHVNEVRESMFDLETELIIYRHLLIDTKVTERVVSVNQPVINEVLERFVIENKKKRIGLVGFRDCAPNGTSLTLKNYSTTKDIDISKWMIKRRIDSTSDLFYTIPEGVRIEHEQELMVHANENVDQTALRQGLVNKDLNSWGTGNRIETILFNRNGDEEASYIQSHVFKNEQLF